MVYVYAYIVIISFLFRIERCANIMFGQSLTLSAVQDSLKFIEGYVFAPNYSRVSTIAIKSNTN